MSHRSPQSTLNGGQTQSTLQKLSTANEQTWLLIGRCAEQLSSLEHALSAYENALRHNPMSLPGLSQLAGIYRVKENYPKAIEYFQKVLALNEENGEVWSALGHCYLMQDDLQKAYSAYQQALYLLPNPKEDPKLWYGIGILYDRYGSLDHAEEAFSSVLRMDKDLDFDKANEILFRLGIIYKQQGKYNESLSCFDRILRNPPSPLAHADIWFQIGHVYEQQGDHARAKDAYERVVADNPTHAKVLQQLGWLYHQDGSGFQNQDLAIQYLTKSLEADSSDAQSWYLLGRAYMAGAKYNKAYEAYQQAVYRDGRNPTFWCSIGVLYFQINQFRDALDAYSRAIRINPYISEVWFDLGSLYESCNNQLGDAIDAYARAAELDPGNTVIKERLALLREAQRNGGVLPPGAGTSPTSPSAPNGSANGTAPDNRNGLGPAPIPQDVHPTAYASSVGPPGVSAFDRDRGDRDRDRDRDRLPFSLLDRERGERDRDRRGGGPPPPPLLLTQPPSSSRGGGEISLPPPSINGTTGPGVAANGATPSANGRTSRVELQPINVLGLSSSTSSSAIPGSPASTSYRGALPPPLDDRDRELFGSRRGPSLAPMDVDRPAGFREALPRDWRDERARDLLRDRDFPFRPSERADREREREPHREDRTVLLHQPIPERTNGLSHHTTPHPQIQIPAQLSSRRTPATSPTSARPRSVQPQTGPAVPPSRAEGNPRVSPTLGPGGRSPRSYTTALPDRRSEMGLGPGGSSVFYPPRSSSRASVASIERERERERGDRDVIMRDVERDRDERGRYWEPTSSRGMMGPGAPPPPPPSVQTRSARGVPEETSPSRYDTRFMAPPSATSSTAPTAVTPHSHSSRSSESPHPSGSISGDNGTPAGTSSKRKRGEKTEKVEEPASSAGNKKKKRASGRKKDEGTGETTSFKLMPVNNNSYDAETPDSKSSRRPSPTGVRIPSRVTDDDYDEPGVADALMGLSTFRSAKPPSPPSRVYRGHSQHGSISSNRSHTSPTPQPSSNSKRPLSPSPESDSGLKRSRMDVDKPSPPNSAVHPSGRRTPLPSTRPSPIPFLMQPTTQSPPHQQSDRERGYNASSPSLQSVVLPPHPRPIGTNGGPQRRDSGSDQLPPIATLSPQSDTSEREREREEFQEWQRERRRIMSDNPRSSPSSGKRSTSPVAKKEDA